MPPAPWWKGTRGEWYLAVQGLLLALIAIGPLLPAGPLGARWPLALARPAWLVGLLMMLAGLALGGAGLLGLGRSLSALPHPKDDAEFVEAGAYRLVRHPIYAGLVLGAAGWALVTASGLTLLLALVLLVFFDIKSRREERWLMAKFPAYAAYRRRVKKFIPFVY